MNTREGLMPDDPVSISMFLDDAEEPIATYKPPATFQLDTNTIPDGEHVLGIHAVDAIGNVGVRRIPFTVANGPGITVTGLRAGSRVRGTVTLNVNAFGADEPFDPVRAESSGPVPVWTWVFCAIIAAWAAWYGLEYFKTPPEFAQTPTFAQNPSLAAANAPAKQTSVQSPAPISKTAAVGSKNVAGFDYSSLGAQVYSQNCASCHGAGRSRHSQRFSAPGRGSDRKRQRCRRPHQNRAARLIRENHQCDALRGADARIWRTVKRPQIAAVIDHERTSWGNHGPTVTPAQVTRDR